MCSLEGDKLVRPPKGYDPDHPLIEDLKRKDVLAMTPLSEADACSPDFMSTFVRTCKASAPLIRFLTEAIGLEY